jgi:hypothetical protein
MHMYVMAAPSGKYLSEEFHQHLAAHGMKHQLTVHDTPKENGVAEHLNQTLLEYPCAMLIGSDLPKFLWGEVVTHATYPKNWMSIWALPNQTLFEVTHGIKPISQDSQSGARRSL